MDKRCPHSHREGEHGAAPSTGNGAGTPGVVCTRKGRSTAHRLLGAHKGAPLKASAKQPPRCLLEPGPTQSWGTALWIENLSIYLHYSTVIPEIKSKRRFNSIMIWVRKCYSVFLDWHSWLKDTASLRPHHLPGKGGCLCPASETGIL